MRQAPSWQIHVIHPLLLFPYTQNRDWEHMYTNRRPSSTWTCSRTQGTLCPSCGSRHAAVTPLQQTFSPTCPWVKGPGAA